jgi:hypothetical protein
MRGAAAKLYIPVMSTSYQRYGVLFCRTTCLNQRAKCEVAFFVSVVIATSWGDPYLCRTNISPNKLEPSRRGRPRSDGQHRFAQLPVILLWWLENLLRP